MSKPKFVTMRLGKDSVRDIGAIDSRSGGIQNPAYELTMLTSCGSISGHLVTIPYQIIKHIPTSALLEA